MRRAAVYLKLNNPGQALKDADAAVRMDAKYAKAYLQRAAACAALEQFEEAVRAYQKVCRSCLLDCHALQRGPLHQSPKLGSPNSALGMLTYTGQ